MRGLPLPLSNEEKIANTRGVATIAVEVLIVVAIYWPQLKINGGTSDHPFLVTSFLYALAVTLPSLYAVYLWRNRVSFRNVTTCVIVASTGAALFLFTRWQSTSRDHFSTLFRVEAIGLFLCAFGLAEIPRLLWLRQKSERSKLLGLWESLPGDEQGVRAYGSTRMNFFPNGRLLYTILSDSGMRTFRMAYSVEGNTILTTQAGAAETGTARFALTNDGTLLLFQKGVKSQYRRVSVRQTKPRSSSGVLVRCFSRYAVCQTPQSYTCAFESQSRSRGAEGDGVEP